MVFGYEKAEGIATKILSLVIFYAGMQMLLSSVANIFSDATKEVPSAIAIYVTVFSIIGKCSCWPIISINKEKELIAPC